MPYTFSISLARRSPLLVSLQSLATLVMAILKHVDNYHEGIILSGTNQDETVVAAPFMNDWFGMEVTSTSELAVQPIKLLIRVP